MNYPFWDVGIGYGILMATIAVVHVFVSHFAIGGGLYLVIAEISARRRNDMEKLDYLQTLTKFFVLVSVVFGALTGVGIWFIIGLLNPAGTEVLIHNFVWGWAIEWTFFLVEICAAILYYLGWKRMTARNHQMIGWIYFIAAWLSLVIINGIITFMLTPGKWLETGYFWHGFFNPTYWPSLVMRTGVCVMLAGLYALVVASRTKSMDFKKRIVRYNAAWALAGLIIITPAFLWYLGAIPDGLMAEASERMAKPMTSLGQMYLFGGFLAVIFVIFGLIRPRNYTMSIGVVAMVAGLIGFGAFEWFRESLRKPFVIYGYMYGNAVELAHADAYQRDGYLAHIRYRTGNDGTDLFLHACRSCHTIDGYQPLKPAFDGTDPAFIGGMIRSAHVARGNMPRFLGTEQEIELLASYIHSRIDPRTVGEIYGLRGEELGEKVFEIRCGGCHILGGYNDISETLIGQTNEDYVELLEFLGDLAEDMPPFTGNEAERDALIAYFKTLGTGEAR